MRSINVATLLAVSCLLLTACTRSADAGGHLAGTCFADPPRDLETTGEIDCEDAGFEIVAVDTLGAPDGSPYPGALELSTATFDRCLDAAEEYVGSDLPALGLDIWFHHPSEDSWAEGDRRFVCAVEPLGDPALGGSVVRSDG